MVQVYNFERVEGQFHIAVFGVFIPQDNFYLENIKVCRSKSGRAYLKLPTYKNSKGEWCSVCRWEEEKAKIIISDIKKVLEKEGKVSFSQPTPTEEPTPF